MNLTKLNLWGTKVDGDVKGLSSLVNLTELSLGGTKVDGDVQGFYALVTSRNSTS